MSSKISESFLGPLFEISFNLGLLTYIKQKNIKHHYGDIYLKDLQSLSFKQIKKRIIENEKIINPGDIKTFEQWSLFFLQKGFLSGYNFLREYLDSLTNKLERLEIYYFQCSFSGDNSFGCNPKGEEQIFREVLTQLTQKSVDIGHYRGKGEFLRADTLMLLKNGRKEWRILSLDTSIFSVRQLQDLKDLEDIEVIRNILLKEIQYLKSKSIFANLSIDTGGETQPINLTLDDKLSGYFTAFGREDKESSKLIQAGGYAYSFYQFLQQIQFLTPDDPILFNIIGYTDRALSAMCVYPNNVDILKKCQSIYQQKLDSDKIDKAREKVVKTITRNAKYSFAANSNLFTSLKNLSVKQTEPIISQERITGFLNLKEKVPQKILEQVGLSGEMSLRQAHNYLVHNALESDKTYVFLTGNPGIGKTTALVKFLEEHFNEGFLFLYVSPRKQVNLDIIDKFQNISDPKKKEQLFAINTDSQIIQSQGGKPTVQYFSQVKQEDFLDRGVNFLKATPERDFKPKSTNRLKQEKENLIIDRGNSSTGVLNSLFQALGALIEGDISRQVVAAFSIQSLKKTKQDKDTLDHFETLFKSAYNQKRGKVIPEKMQAISTKFKHLFIMIDEITGDPSGVAFLNKIASFLYKYELLDRQHGFNTKIIVADASIVENNVIEQHLSSSQTEPNKIFYRSSIEVDQPISQQEFTFSRLSAIAINTNSYPASELILNYKIFTESIPYDENRLKSEKSNLIKTVNSQILIDLKLLLEQPETGQIIVYIQNKNRLQQLIDSLTDNLNSFKKFIDYLEIHSNISEQEKAKIKECTDRVKIIFMTASASRGLSFPKVKHILVDIPRFSVEQNLMEIIQVIYRGRGSYQEEGKTLDLEESEKELTFYLSELMFYEVDNSQLSLQEGVLNIINILLILKAAILTRIKGSSQIGKGQYKIIPVGGKSILSAEETFTGGIAKFIEELKNEAKRHPNDQLLSRVSGRLEKLLGEVNIKIRDLESTDSQNNKVSYLSLREPFSEKFNKYILQGFDQLLDFPEIEPCYITGSLLIVPLRNKKVQEIYQILLDQHLTEELLNQIRSITYNPDYPKSLHSSAFSVFELIYKLKESESYTQQLQQRSQRSDQYYAVPMFIFTSSQVMEEYFKKGLEDPDNNSFRSTLETYVSSLFPLGYVLPIGCQYDTFPFIFFTSYSLEEIRHKLFTKQHLLTSSELNILNLILSQE